MQQINRKIQKDACDGEHADESATILSDFGAIQLERNGFNSTLEQERSPHKTIPTSPLKPYGKMTAEGHSRSQTPPSKKLFKHNPPKS